MGSGFISGVEGFDLAPETGGSGGFSPRSNGRDAWPVPAVMAQDPRVNIHDHTDDHICAAAVKDTKRPPCTRLCGGTVAKCCTGERPSRPGCVPLSTAPE